MTPLYLYTTEAGLLSIIDAWKIKISKPWATNDITEGVPRDQTRQLDALKGFGYICLTSTCTSPAMWGYYADRSRGACLRFDFPLADANKPHFTFIDAIAKKDRLVMKVRYRENKSGNGNINNLLSTKSSTWSNELEYRVIYSLASISKQDIVDKGSEVLYYARDIMPYMTAIVLGANCQWQHPEILAKLQLKGKSKIDIYRAISNPDNFEFDLRPCIIVNRDDSL